MTKPFRAKPAAPRYPALSDETRLYVDTDCAAYHLNRTPQTLRGWACRNGPSGPLSPIRLQGRLAWSVEDLRRVLSGENCNRSAD